MTNFFARLCMKIGNSQKLRNILISDINNKDKRIHEIEERLNQLEEQLNKLKS